MLFSREELLAALKETKPNNPYTDETRERILNTPYFQKALAQLKEKNEQTIDEPLPMQTFSAFEGYFSTGSRSAFVKGYNPPRHRLSYHALSAWLFDDARALRATEDILWAILNEYSWAPPYHISSGESEENKRNVALDVVMHDDTYIIDLQAAETGASVADCLRMLGDRLHPFLVKRARFELERRIFVPFLTSRFVWETKNNNWASVCASNISLAALWAIEDEERLADIFEKAFSSLEHYLSGFSHDGVCLEGLGYWNYGFGPYVTLADCLYERTGGVVDLFHFDIVERVAKFYSKCFFKGQRTVSFADGNTTAGFVSFIHSVLLKHFPELEIPSEFVNLDLQDDSRLHHTSRFFLATTEEYAKSSGTTYGTYLFPEAQWYISSSKNGIGLAAKGGHNDEPHNHNDVGNFQIYKNGEEILSDLGCGEYTLDYFSPKRYECFAPSSRSHSLPIINGKYQCQGKQCRAENVSMEEGGITLDMARAYADETLTSLYRTLRFDRECGRVVLCDSYTFTEAPSSVTERLISSGTAEILADGIVRIQNGNECMYVLYDSTSLLARIRIFEDNGRYGEPRKTTAIDFEVKAPQTSFAFSLTIQSENE